MTNIVNTIVVIPAKIAFWFRSVVYTFGSMWILDKKLEAVSTKTKKTRDDSSRSSAPLNDTSLDTVRAELLYSIKEYLRTLRDCLGSPLCGRWLSDPKNSGVYLKCAADLCQSRLNHRCPRMCAGDLHSGLIGVPGLPRFHAGPADAK